jgi:retron-type reverse transcriptase
MPSDNLMTQLLKPEILKRGWHLARLDTKHDFAEDLYSSDVFGTDLKLHIREIINRLQTGTYQPRPLLRMEVPKGSLGFRPGAVIPIQDRVVVSAIVLLIAPIIDKKFPKSVYSWRLKDPLPKTGAIFKETDIADIPFLKQETIKARIDPFDSWYEVWPEFDEESRNAFLKDEYRYLATTDIAAYFENIQLPILRDQLLSHLPTNLKIVNLLFSFLESWALKTADGRPQLRGIPQGNFISSFLGNMFLMPLDEYFRQFQSEYDILYYRYMDDARIFTKSIADARRVIFSMDRELRKLHLNVQTAKTKIMDEKHKEITHALIDDRVDKITSLVEELEKIRNILMSARDKKRYLSHLNKIAHQDNPVCGVRSTP